MWGNHWGAELCWQNLNFLTSLNAINASLAAAAGGHQKGNLTAKEVLNHLDTALDTLVTVKTERNRVLAAVTAVWYEAWHPRVTSANGRTHLFAYDDVKDHLPMRTVDMSYLIYRELLLPMGAWGNATASARNQFAAAHSLPARAWAFDWGDTSASGEVSSALSADGRS